jgi:hypothetical protein
VEPHRGAGQAPNRELVISIGRDLTAILCIDVRENEFLGVSWMSAGMNKSVRPSKRTRGHMMLNLQFNGLGERNRLVVGPAPSFRVARTAILAGPGIVVARLQGHWWRTDGRCFGHAECGGPVVVSCVDASGTGRDSFGWFDQVIIADGELFADGRLFALYIRERGLWRCCTSGRDWPTVALLTPNSQH